MKKLLILLLVALLLSSCGDDSSNEVSNDNEQSETSKNSESNNNNDDEVEHTLNENKKLGLTTEEMFGVPSIQNDSDSFTETKTYETENGYTVDSINGANGNLQFFIYLSDGAEYPSALIAKTNDAEVVIEQAVSILEEVAGLLDEEAAPYTEAVVGDEEERYQLAGLIFNREYDINELPVFISDIVTDDFFSNDANVESYRNSLSRAEYKELYEEVASYINENEISEHDSAYEIKEILEPIQESMDKVEVYFDDLDNVSTIYYQGLTDVNSENHIVPFITTEHNEMNILVGFEKDGWLFSEKLYFNLDGERETFGTFDPSRETLGGSRIREEFTKTTYDEELTEKIINANEARMRFEGDKGELDYTLTNTDIEAIKTIQLFNGIRNDLSNLLYRFENN